jgi:hypothetical protein
MSDRGQLELFPASAVPATRRTRKSVKAAVAAPKRKATAKDACICGHLRKEHCSGASESHTTPYGTFWCLYSHCLRGGYVNGEFIPCDCFAFRLHAADVPKMKRPRCGDYDLCLSCSHIRGHHCTPHLPRKEKALVPRPCENCGCLRSERYWGRDCPKCRHWSKPEWKAKLAATLKQERTRPPWLGFEFGGEVYRCQHVNESDPALPVRCNTSACASSDDGKTFCPCTKYRSPWARAGKPATRRRSTKPCSASGDLFPTAETTAEGFVG